MCCFNSSLHSNHLTKLQDMENLNTKSSPKLVRSVSHSATSWSSNSRMTRDEVLKYQIYYDKYNKAFQKTNTIKENTKPQEIKLRTQERAIKRAMFNYEVATKLFIEEQQKKQQERLQKMIEEEEIRMLRKEMIPRAQLMPFFDRPFFPQRSNRALTVPREPSFRMMGNKCSFSKKTSGKYSTCISNNIWLLQSPTESSSQSH